MPWTAAAIAGSAVLGAGTSILGSQTAAGSAKAAAGQQQQQYNLNRTTSAPYFERGSDAMQNALQVAQTGQTGGGPDYVAQAAARIPGQMTQADLEQTPGYQFTLNQGLKSTQSAAAARGLGVSGAALKGAATYATGLADKTYLDQFNVQQQRFGDYLNMNTAQQGNLTNQFNRLNSLATIGENAANQTGAQGTQAAATAGNYLNQAGLAQAAGYQGVGNALTSGVNNYLGYNAMQTALDPTTRGYVKGGSVNTNDPATGRPYGA
jgi:hypothetical protein